MHPRVAELIDWQSCHGTLQVGESELAPPCILPLTICPPLQKSDAWLAARRGKITASDAAAILGQNPYRSPIQVMRGKLGLEETPFTGNEATRHGEKYEDEAVQKYEKDTGTRVRLFGLLPHPTLPYLAGSPDGITEDGILIEVKVGL